MSITQRVAIHIGFQIFFRESENGIYPYWGPDFAPEIDKKECEKFFTPGGSKSGLLAKSLPLLAFPANI